MKAAVYRRYGPPDVVRIEDVEKPVPRDDQVLVRIYATTICAPDWRFRKPEPFFIRLMNGLSRPKKVTVLGLEFAGIVESAGKDVTRFRAGDAVFGSMGLRFGAHAEYACVVPDKRVERKPETMTYEEAAPIAFGGISALHFLRKAGIRPGQNVLIYGASGSVGTAAVQLAKHFGARVTAVCGAANLDLVKSLGADAVVDYTKEDFSRAGRVYDIVFDAVGKCGFRRAMRSLKRGGVLASAGLVMFGGMRASIKGAAKVISGVARFADGDLAFLKGLVEAGELRTAIDRRYPLGEIAEAHRYVEAGHKKGNVVIVVE